MSKIHDLHRTVADRILELMERDGLSWAKSWAAPVMPFNAVTGNTYSGCNVLTTCLKMMDLGTQDPRFFSRSALFGKNPVATVRKGEKSTPILFYGFASERDSTEQDEGGQGRKYRFGRIYHLWHITQVEIIDPKRLIPFHDTGEGHTFDNEQVDAFVKNTGAHIKHDYAEAFYSPTSDKIGMPPQSSFLSKGTTTAEEHYYSVLLHELTHWTGHARRLDRDQKGTMATASYAYEELIAELGSVMLGMSLGVQIEPREDNAAYLQHWMKRLSENPETIFTAAADASKAFRFLNDLQASEQAA